MAVQSGSSRKCRFGTIDREDLVWIKWQKMNAPQECGMQANDMAKIRWAPPLRPILLERLYRSDAKGIQDVELCDEVGISLYARCCAFARVGQREVECPICGTPYTVLEKDRSFCPKENCGWHTDWPTYKQSLRNYGVHTGRAVAAYLDFERRYPSAKTYGEKIILIDQLIHSFHIDEKTGSPVKSIASKLLEGNKKSVVKFLDDLSALNSEDKERWRHDMRMTIDSHIVRQGVEKEG